MASKAEHRRELIVRELHASGYVASASMAARMGVSDMTVRRDMHVLEEQGLGRRVPGGLGLPSALPEHVLDRALPFGLRDDRCRDIKVALCRAAAALIGPEALVGVDAGTTVAPLARLLPAGVTVVSHSLPLLQGATVRGDIGVVVLGGWWLPETRAFCGAETRLQLEEMTLDVAVLSCAALSERGAFSAHAPDVDVKRAMIRVARRVVLLADAGKLDQHAMMRFAELSELDDVIISGPPPEWLANRAGVHQVGVRS